MNISGVNFTGGFIVSPAVDPQFNYVTALLHGDGASAGTNNTFLDSSTNNFAITRTGNVTQGSFAPYGTLWSNFFGTSTSNLKFGSSASFAIGTGNFTIQCSINFTAWAGTNQRICIQGVSGTTNVEISRDSGANELFVVIQNSRIITYAWVPNIGQWYNIALVRSGTGTNQVVLYIDGVSVATGTSSASIAQNQFIVGGLDWGSGYSVQGYISNFRYSNIARTIGVPTSPYTSDANTIILTCQSNRFVDNSSNAFAVTVNGTPSVQPSFSPFGATIQYNPATNGGSGYFNASTDYLTAPNTAAQFGSSNWTVEGWVYLNSVGSVYHVLACYGYNSVTTRSWIIYIDLGGTLRLAQSTTGSDNFDAGFGTPTFVANTWYYVAVVRNGATITAYQNGVALSSTQTAQTLFTSSAAFTIGSDLTNYLSGYISDLRVVNGTAVYTTNFTPPTIPVTSIANTSLLLNFTNGQIFGSAMTNNFITAGNAQVSTSIFKYGTGSIFFNGTTGYLTAPSSPLFAFGTGAWTVEAWVYVTTFQEIVLFDTRSSVSTAGIGCTIWTDGKLYYSGSANNLLTNTSITTNTWNHVAWVYNGTTLTGYINGVSGGTATPSFNLTQNNCFIGRVGFSASGFMAGYVDEFRVTKGYARYTSNFTAPTSQFPSTGPIPLYTSTVEYLLVAGGAAGGGRHGGGGGAGGVLSSSSLAATLGTTYAITVGAGGAATTEVIGNNGVNSSITTGYSYNFNGSSQYLSIADNAAFNFGTGDATVEFWFNSPGTANNYPGIISSVNYNVSGSASIRFDNTGYKGKVYMYINGGGDPVIASTSTIAYNTWCHVAITRTGTSLKLYLNGVLNTTVAISAALGWYLSASGMRIGRGFDVDGANGYYPGYISNVRLVKGVVVYTGNFTVPTGPLSYTQSANPFGGSNTSAITGTQTSLLTLQNATIVDNSTNAFAITNNGSVVFSTSAPYGTSIISIGGGGGGVYPTANAPGNTGGSGGGAGSTNGSSTGGAAGTAGQGNSGGNSTYNATNDTRATGGGGGAGGAGTSGTSTVQSNGGIGVVSSINGTSLYWGGGGGGSLWVDGGVAGVPAGNGGLGGGGGGSSQNRTTPGSVAAGGTGGGSALNTGGNGVAIGGAGNANGGAGGANTGGGGGGCAQYYTPYSQTGVSGAGGSGVVILRYPSGFALPSSTTGSPTITAIGGYRIYTWTSSGSITF